MATTTFGGSLHIRLFGSVEVLDEDANPIAVGPPKRRIVLAVLALDVGRVVSTVRLIEAVWGADPPRSALATLQGLVYQLRQSLGTDTIVSRSPGYLIPIDRATVDVTAIEHGLDTATIDDLESVLNLASGRALDDLGDGDVVEAARQNLEELRLRAFERWCDLALAAGRSSAVVAKVEYELRTHRWRESLWARLMLALYRSDRQADAVRAFDRARHQLVDSLGLDPGVQLTQLNYQILNHDPALDIVRAGETTPRTNVESRRDPQIELAGRVGELAHLANRVMNAASSVSMVVGEPGIGKTRLVRELSERALAHGHLVLWGTCPDGDWVSPYAPLAEAFGRHLATIGPGAVSTLLGPNTRALADVLPTFGRPEGAASQDNHPSDVQFEILEGFATLVRALATAQPVLLVLDDLHWVDSATATALSFLVPLTRTDSFHIVGTYRDTEVSDDHPISAVMAGLPRDAQADHVRLRGLTATASKALVNRLSDSMVHDSAAGHALVDEATTDGLVAVAGGNPFFLTELVRHRIEQSEGGHGDPSIPASVYDTITQRLKRLHPNTGALLRVGAIFNDRFPFAATMAVADLTEDSALDALDEAIRVHLVEPTDHFDEYQFVHALTREAARSTINPSRLARMTRRLATTLNTERIGPASSEHLALVASLYHASRDLPGAEDGVEPALAAASRANAMAAHSERADLLELAIELMPRDDPRRHQVGIDLVTSRVRSYRTEEAIELGLSVAHEISMIDGEDAACVFLARLIVELRTTGSWSKNDTWYQWLDAGLEYGVAGQPAGFSFLFATRHAMRIIDLGSWEFRGRAQLFEDPEFVRHGRSSIDDGFGRVERLGVIAAARNVAEARDATARCSVNLSEYSGDLRTILGAADARVESARRYRQFGSIVDDLGNAAGALACLGQVRQARDHVAEMIAVQQSIPSYFGRLLATAMTDAVVTGIADGPWPDHIERVNAVWSMTDAAVGQEHLRTRGQTERDCRTIAARALVDGRRGRFERAVATVGELIEYLWEASVCEQSYTQVAFTCADVIWFSGNTRFAGEVKAALSERWLPLDFRYYWTDVRLALARLYAVEGNIGEAVAWFKQARTVFESEGAISLSAIVDHDEAWAHIRHPGVASDAEVRQLLDRAIEQFTSIGMPGWLVRANALRDGLVNAPRGQR
jgi:DNA-binding SARP family transcriptional activator/tetratricopeptide (TPR) repeat protein